VDATTSARFAERGAVLAPGLFDRSWIELVRAVADRLVADVEDPSARLAGAATAPARSSDGIWRRDADFARFLRGSPIADAAAIALDSRSITLYEDLFLYTDADLEGAPWHRDSPHWPLMGDQLCSVWFSLEPVELDTGALHFVSGSHRDSRDVVAAETMVLDATPSRPEIFGFATEPGDAVIFHPRILHSARGAAPDRPRRTFTIRFAGDDIRWRPRSSYYHQWMSTVGFERGERLDHPWFPVLRDGPQAPR
jgi:ectoine hydroxylase-related dioxygenase (phytanoyl-CoA dioxygenase family)